MFEFRSGGLWFETQSLQSCCFLRQETLPHILSLPPSCKDGQARHTAWGNLAAGASIPFRGQYGYSEWLHAKESKLRPCGLLDLCVPLPTLIYLLDLR